jgi:hypothetical protein
MHLRNLSLSVLLALVTCPVHAAEVVPLLQETDEAPSQAPAPSAPANNAPAVDTTKQGKDANTASGNVEQAVASAVAAVEKSDSYKKSITAITQANRNNPPVLEDVQSIEAMMSGVSDVMGALNTAKTALDPDGSLESSRRTACSSLPQSSSSDPDVTDAIAKCARAQKKAADTYSAVNSAISDLQSALQAIYTYVSTQIGSLNIKLKPLLDLPGATPDADHADQLLTTLANSFSALRQAMQIQEQGRLQTAWTAISSVLKQLKISAPTSAAASPSADDQLKALTDSTDRILPKVHLWFTAITQTLLHAAKTLDGMIPDVENDPAKNSAAALGAIRDQSDTLARVQTILDGWPLLAAYLTDGQPADFNLRTTKNDFQNLQSAVLSLKSAVVRLSDARTGDFSNFQTSQVSLYYFTDVKRLMYVLNPALEEIGGVAEAQQRAADQRAALTKAEFELSDAQATVNRYQKQVADLQEERRQGDVKLKNLNANVSRLASRLKSAQDSKDNADAAYQQAQEAQNAAPNDPTKTSALNRASAHQAAAATKLSRSQSDYDSAKTERDNAQKQQDDAQSQSDGLPAKIAAAQQSLSDAQTAVSEDRRKMLMAAEAESDAFAFARDNAPFLYAPADAASPDPAKRVMLYAFNDSKTIFMRGNPDDIALVKLIIADFDQPAPQARLTLWTFQLSAEAEQKTNKKSARHLNKAMEIVDEELADTRALQNTTLDLLRALINQEVRNYTLPAEKEDCPNCTPADVEKLHRLGLYDPSVLLQLNFDRAEVSRNRSALRALRRLLPDPASTTTLGEALVVLILAKQEIKNRVRQDFESKIRDSLTAVARPGSDIWPRENLPPVFLPLTWQALGIWPSGVISEEHPGLSPSALEIVRALRASYDSYVLRGDLDDLESWYTELSGVHPGLGQTQESSGLYMQLENVRRQLAQLEDRGRQQLTSKERARLAELDAQGESLAGDALKEDIRLRDLAVSKLPLEDQATYVRLDFQRLQLEARLETILQFSGPVMEDLRAYGIDVTKMGAAVTRLSQSPTDKKAAGEYAQAIGSIRLAVAKKTNLGTASPRQAAGDEMLKGMIIAIEDDLAKNFIQPMITRLRTRLTSKAGVNVGILQRESMLASNRGKARVDPSASAQLAVGDEEDILSGIQQLAQLYTTVQSGGALAALGALQAQPREPQPEIYALTTGNKFEVTPIFDPTGQALRFKFDFVSASKLQEPNGTLNPQLARIERHTVNTEVQLSNLETREISRFEVNSRLGLPTRYWGGFPVLKDIPYVRPWVPLIGWFVRKGGSNAVAQQSVMFGQTTIYPSIGSLIGLVADTGPVPSDTSSKDSATGKH